MIVEDDERLRKLLRENLKSSYEIIETDDPRQVLQLTLELNPDCILLDLVLPDFSGLELCSILGSLHRTKLIPVIVISGLPAVEYKTICQGLGAVDYVEKPLRLEHLKRRLETILKDRQGERRTERRIPLKLRIKLTDVETNLEVSALTNDVSANGFSCTCEAELRVGMILEVSMMGISDCRQVGFARIIRKDIPESPQPRYAFLFIEKTASWILC